MPILRCPSCYFATTTRRDSIQGVKCSKCGTDLFEYYYKDKTDSEAAHLISQKGAEFKKKKAKAERELKKQNATSDIISNRKLDSKPSWNAMLDIRSLTESVAGYVIPVAIVLSIYGGIQYFQLRSGVQESTIEMLHENGYPGYEADGITLPLSAAFGGITTAKVFLRGNGGTQAIDVEVTQKGIPILSIFVGSEYYTEISGVELMQLR
jgi:predicted  nucleic acid-binding Zn-ribbon protein